MRECVNDVPGILCQSCLGYDTPRIRETVRRTEACSLPDYGLGKGRRDDEREFPDEEGLAPPNLRVS
jgi:hypothetical protein